MDGVGGDGAGPAKLDLAGVLFRAALLAGHGRDARDLAARLAALCGAASGRSCVDAGNPLQLTVDAPGEAELSVALTLGPSLRLSGLSTLIAESQAQALVRGLSALPPADHPSLGFWLFWSRRRQSIFADLRDPLPARAIERLRLLLDSEERRRLQSILARAIDGRPWGVSLELDENRQRRLRLYWFASRPSSACRLLEIFAPGRWQDVVTVLGHLLKRPGESGRWMISLPLDSGAEADGIVVGTSAWALTPEGESKHRAVGQLMAALGGPRDYAEALWSFCRGAARSGWRVGRSCEVYLDEDGPRARLFFTPEVQPATTADTSSSEPAASATGPTEAAPSSA